MIYKWVSEEISVLNNKVSDTSSSYCAPPITVDGKLQDVHMLIEFMMSTTLFNDDDKSKLKDLFVKSLKLKTGHTIERKSLDGAAGKQITLKDRARYEDWIRRMTDIVQK